MVVSNTVGVSAAPAPAPAPAAGGAGDAAHRTPRPSTKKAAHEHALLLERGYILGDLLGKGGFGQVNRVTKADTGEVYVTSHALGVRCGCSLQARGYATVSSSFLLLSLIPFR